MYIHTYILRSCCLKCLFQLGLDTAQSIYKRGMVIVKIWWALYNIETLQFKVCKEDLDSHASD